MPRSYDPGELTRSEVHQMDRQPVNSSNLVSVGYDSSSGTLEVEFNDSLYQYFDVPEAHYTGILGAESPGTYLNTHVKGSYQYQKM